MWIQREETESWVPRSCLTLVKPKTSSQVVDEYMEARVGVQCDGIGQA